MRKAAITALAAMVLAAMTGTVAWGHDARFPTKVTIHDDNHAKRDGKRRNITFHFYGRVKSAAPACERGRTVKLYDKNADEDGGPTQQVGQTTSDDAGNWSVEIDNKPQADLYFARATRKVVRRPGHKHVCNSGRSRDYFYFPF